jgi:hypothetical protein
MLHFAYGSNMHPGLMRRHAPDARAIGSALLSGYRFLITADGYASVEEAAGEGVHGMLWAITPRDRVLLDGWENVAGGLYRAAMLPVQAEGRTRQALVYLARPRPPGRPKAGYMELVVEAAEASKLPADYIAELKRWLPTQPSGAGHGKLGEFE